MSQFDATTTCPANLNLPAILPLLHAQMIVALNGGSHANPCFAGDTVRAWSEVLDRALTAVPGVGAA